MPQATQLRTVMSPYWRAAMSASDGDVRYLSFPDGTVSVTHVSILRDAALRNNTRSVT